MKRKTFSVVCVLMLLLVNLFAFPVYAEETGRDGAALTAGDEEKSSHTFRIDERIMLYLSRLYEDIIFHR